MVLPQSSVPLPPAFPPGAADQAAQRPQTAFEAYLSSRRRGDDRGTAAAAPFTGPQLQQPQHAQKPQQDLGAAKPRQAHQNGPVSGVAALQQAAAPWLQQQESRAAALPQTPRSGLSAPLRPAELQVAGSRPATGASNRGGAEQPLAALAQAAASLAVAARSLATSPRGSPHGPALTVSPQMAASYSALADAAASLAANASGGRLPASGEAPPQQAAPPAASAGLPPQAPPAPDSRGLLLPFSNGSAGAEGAPGSVVPAGRVSTPKFRPLNPLVVMQAVQQQQQQAAATAGGRPESAATPGAQTLRSRPGTSNPITHTLEPDLRPPTSRQATAGLARGPSGSQARRTPGPGDAGSDVAQVLHVEQGPEAAPGANGGSGAAGAGAGAGAPAEEGGQGSGRATGGMDPVQFYLTHPHRVRLERWPPPTPITQSEVDEDEYAMRYNNVLGKMRERLLTHGVSHIVRGFKQADEDGSGQLDVREFGRVLHELDLGVPLDDRVVGMLMSGIDKDQDGTLNYLEFVEAVRFNQLPYKQYSQKFRHRAGGDPDQPFGNPSVKFPWGTLGDIARNNQSHRDQLDVAFKELRLAFQAMDLDGDGVVDREEFTAALQWLNERHKLKLTDEYIRKAFREADADYSQAIDYNEFLASFAGTAATRFVPEFLKPQSMRCSSLAPPWEDRLGASQEPGAKSTHALRSRSVSGAGAAPVTTPGATLRLPPATPGGTPLQPHQRLALMQQFFKERTEPSLLRAGNGGPGPGQEYPMKRLTTQASRLLRHLQS